MSDFKILDVTLRDGGYVNNWDFSQQIANAIVGDLSAAGIDFVEIGYRNFPAGHVDPGLSGRTSDDYIKAIRAAAPNAKLSVMYSPDTVTLKDMEQLAEQGVSMVRCSIPAGALTASMALIKRGRDLGMLSTANLTTITEYKVENLIDDCNKIIDNGCSVVYIADSNGSMTPNHVKLIFNLIKTKVQPIPLGFHNHNNLGFAMANVVEAVNMGADYIDCTLRGMGRASGNVPTESLVTFFNQNQQRPDLNLLMVLNIANYLVANVPVANLKPTLEDMALGAFDFFTNVQSFITDASAEYGVSWYGLISKMASLNLDKPNITLQQVQEIARRLSVP